VCAYEAATFSQVLGRDVSLSRRETLASGASACVCCVTPKTAAGGTAASRKPATTTPTGPSTSPQGRGDDL
jgi:hypothetical protein